MTVAILPNPKQQYFSTAGKPLSGGKVYTYAAGTSTPKATYSDAAGTIPNANPVILDSRGEATIFWSGTYKVVLTTSADATIYTQDNITSSDVDLRTDLASTAAGKGVDLVARSVQPVATKAAMQALDGAKFTSAILQVSDDKNQFDFVSGDRTADVTADPGAGYYVAPTSAPTGSAGVWTSRLQRIRPSMFDNDGATAAETLIQRMWNVAAYEAGKNNPVVCEIDKPYTPNALLYLPSNTVTVATDPDAGIYTQTASGTNFEKQGISFGTFCIPSNYALNNSPGGGTGLGALSGGLYLQRVTFQTIVGTFTGGTIIETDATGYAALSGKEGKPLFVRTAAYYYSSPGAGQVPHASGLAIVKNRFTVGAQYFVTLRDPIPISLGAGAKFAIIDRPIDLTTGLVKRDFLNRVDDYILTDAIVEGLIIEAPTNAMSAHGGMIGCRLDFKSIRGKTGFFTNGSSYCQFRADSIVASNQIIDDAGGGWNSTLWVGSANYNFVSGVSDSTQPFSINEGSNNKRWQIDSVNMGSWATASGAMGAFGSCVNSTASFGIINIPSGSGSVWAANNYQRTATVDTGETQDPSSDNVFRAQNITIGGAAMERTFTCLNDGGQLSRTTLDAGYVKGTLTTSPYTIRGTNMIVRGRWTSSLVPDISTAGTGLDIDVLHDSGTGPLVASTGAKRAFSNGRNLIEPWGPSQSSGPNSSFTPGMGVASTYFIRSINGAGTFTLNAWTGSLTSGGVLITDKVKFRFTNANGVTAISTWTLDAKYQLNGYTIPSLAAGKAIDLIFIPSLDGSTLGLESAVLQA